MGWLMDKLKAKLKKRSSSKAVTTVKKVPNRDVTFLPASVSAAEITAHVNARSKALQAQSGGEDKYAETDFSIHFINKLADNDMVQEYVLQKETAKNVTGIGNSGADTYDWEPKTVTTEIKDSVDLGTKQFYIIIIEYTVIT